MIQGNAVIVPFNGPPTGTCSIPMLGLDTTTGDLYDCLGGAWHKITGGGGGSPGGANTDVQFNDTGSFGGDASLTWDKVAKALTTSGFRTKVRVVTANDTATAADFAILVSTSVANITESLPAAPVDGQLIYVKMIDNNGNTVHVSGNGHTIDGAATIDLTSQFQDLLVQWSAAQTMWQVVASYGGSLFPTLDQVRDPLANKTFALNGFLVEFLNGITNIDDNSGNIFIGTDSAQAGNYPNVLASRNVGIGSFACGNSFLTTGTENVAVGTFALSGVSSGRNNTAVGEETMKINNFTGSHNTALGAFAMGFVTNAVNENVAIGDSAGAHYTSDKNVALGRSALQTAVTVGLDTCIGYNTQVSSATITNSTALGANATVATSNTIQLGDGNVVLVNTSATYAGAGLDLAIRTVTGNDNATALDYTIRADATAGALTETLLASPPAGQIINVKKIDATGNNVTISGNGHNIDGAASQVLTAQFQSFQMQYDATSTTWNIIAKV